MSDSSDEEDKKQIGEKRYEDFKASDVLFDDEEKVEATKNRFKVEGFVEKVRKDSSSESEESNGEGSESEEEESEEDADSS